MEKFYIILIIYVYFAKGQVDDLSFPDNFTIGIATAAYQIEGAWNISDKGEHIWDRYTHVYPERISNGSNGDVSCDSYHKYKEDVQWIKTIGLDFYRFSISWSRILPNGFANEVSEIGLQYYKNLIQELLDNDIEPVVTLYHWDLPQVLEDLGGWTNELMVEWFADYVRIIFKELGPMVKTFLTMNEPQIQCLLGYNFTLHAPGKILENMGAYLCLHNALKAHATAYHIYQDEFQSEQQGKIGLTIPLDGWIWTDVTNATVVDRYFQFSAGWFMHPIYIGDYPEIMKTRIAMISELEGYSFSRLPEFSDEWVEYIKGTADFFGLNHYASYILSIDPAEELGIYNSDSGVIQTANETWPIGSTEWVVYAPEGFGNVLRMIRDQYDNPPVYIFENGYCDNDGLDDYARMNYFYGYLKEVLSTIKEDGCNVQRYTIWTLMDDFEWASGYELKFGLLQVNHSDPDRPRTPKLSTTWWQSIAETRILQEVPSQSTDST